MPASWPFEAASVSTIRARAQWLVLACALPMVLLALALVWVAYRNDRAALVRATQVNVRELVQTLDHEFDAATRVLQTLAGSTNIDDADLRRFHAQAREAMRDLGADDVLLLDPERRPLVSAARDWGTPLPARRLEPPVQPPARPGPALSDLFDDEDTGRPQASLTVPVLREGRPIAQLEAVFGLRTLQALLLRRELPPSWNASFIDRRGIVAVRLRLPEGVVGKPAQPGLLAMIRSRQAEGTGEGRTVDGAPVLGAFKRSARHGWTAIAGIPVTQLNASLRRSLLVTGAIAAAMLAFGLMLARIMGRRIAAPIQALVAPALAIGRGETAQIADASLHEARELGRALQQAQTLLGERERAREEAVAAMHRTQTRLAIALEVAQIGDWSVDLATQRVQHSRQHDRCFGHEEPIASWSVADFLATVHVEDRARIEASVRRMLRALEPWHEEFRVVWPDGSVHWLTSRCTCLGEPPQWVVGAVIDVTARRQAEELRLHSVRLQAENRQIQEANRLKSEFLANMSHELRTPLNAVIGFADILRQYGSSVSEDKRAEYLHHIAASGRHLLLLINDVLDLSKVESGKLELAPEPLQLQKLAAEVVGVLHGEAARKGLALSTRIDPGLGELVLDPARLKQMLYNLLSNAIKFTEPGGRVELRAQAQGEDALRIEVEDSGIGIAERDLPRLFQQFQQLHSGTTKPYGGTGLGLALTRRLAELHGGSVGVRSTPGVGSVFHLLLPRRVQGLPGAGVRRPWPVAPPAPPPPAAAATVLVIEDDREDQAQLTHILHSAGYAVDIADTAERALQMAGSRRYDAITLDLLLPDRSGLEVLAALRREGLNRDVPVVVVTVVTEHAALAGFAVDDVLVKPVAPEQLQAALRRLAAAGTQPSVLVVDDDPAALERIAAPLQAMGIAVRVAEGGAQALQQLDQQTPDALVIDLLMPGLNGFELLHRLRSDARWRELPVFVWSALQLSNDERSALQASAQAVLDKSAQGLQALVEQLRRWQARQGAAPAAPPGAQA